jgi:hypothetical protein
VTRRGEPEVRARVRLGGAGAPRARRAAPGAPASVTGGPGLRRGRPAGAGPRGGRVPPARALLAGAALAAAILVPAPARPAGPPRLVHGENSVFATPELVLVWAILRRPVEAETEVVVRVAVAAGAYARLAVEGVDPFGGGRRAILALRALPPVLDVRSPRALVADFPRRELHFHRAAEGSGPPDLTVYYLGVPDTAPELGSEAALDRYLDEAVRAARARSGGRAP